jgi:hypothetical protein
MYGRDTTPYSGQQRICGIFPAPFLLSACALFAALLIIVCPAAASTQTTFLPAIYHLLFGTDAGWKNTSLSHPIPLTYNGYDEALRQTRIVQVEDGYWIAYAHYATTNVERRLFIVKTSLEGRTLIPPFQIGTVTRSDDAANSYRFALIPREEGGVQVLATQWDGVSTNNPAVLYDYVLDRQGAITRSGPILTERSDYDQDFKSLWAARTKDGRTIFAALSEGAIWCGVYTDSSDARTWEAVPRPLNGTGLWEYFAASYDPDLDRLFLVYSDYYKTSNGTFLSRWTVDGAREILVDCTPQLGSVYDAYSYQLLPTPEGLLLSLPNYVNTYRFFLLNSDCTIQRQVAVSGLIVNTPSAGHMVTLDGSNIIRLAWRGSGTHNILYYAVFDLDGRLLIPAKRINQEGSDVAMHPHVFVDGNRTTLFYSVDWAPDGGYRRLFCRHLGYDFPAGQPDLVVSVPHTIQSPGIASLDDEIWLLVRVFNRGETDSAPAGLTLTYSGTSSSENIGQLAPGQYQEVTFQGLLTPEYLTSMPALTVAVSEGYWQGNNAIESLVHYPVRTPIYPPGADLYTWTVEDRVTHALLEHALVSIEVPQMLTVDGGTHDIVLLNETDASGEISFRLPDGVYTFHLSKYGYASDNPVVTVPGASSLLTLDPPGDLTLTFVDAEGGALHPVPNRVELTLDEQGGSREYLGRGDENGLLLKEIMPATYTYTISAFGYLSATGTITIHGGTNSLGPVALTPTDRGTVTGHVVSGASALANVAVAIPGTGLEGLTDSSGDFSLSDLPYGTYTASFYKDGYQAGQDTFTLSSGALDIGTIDLPLIPPSSVGDPDLGNWTHAAWNRVDSFPGFLDAPSYKITTTYGAFNLQGSMIYSSSGEAADFSSLTLQISGRKWYYYSVSTEFSLLDIAFSSLGTAGEIVDAAGQVAGFLVDPVGGFLDLFLLDVGIGGSGGQTIVRVDRVALYEGTTVLWDSPMLDRQEYSTDGPMDYTISGAHTDQIQDVTLKVYLKVMNENYSQGPLLYMDTFRFDWRYGNESFHLQKITQNPADYPSLP